MKVEYEEEDTDDGEIVEVKEKEVQKPSHSSVIN